jgi:hypothetical protein
MSARCCDRSVHTNNAIKHRIPGALTSAHVTRTQQIDELYYLTLASPLSSAPSHAISHATTVGFASHETASYGEVMAGRSNQQRRIKFLDVEQADTWQHEIRRDSPHSTYHRQCQPPSTHFPLLRSLVHLIIFFFLPFSFEQRPSIVALSHPSRYRIVVLRQLVLALRFYCFSCAVFDMR